MGNSSRRSAPRGSIAGARPLLTIAWLVAGADLASVAAADSGESLRFAVAHQHSTTWCYGYLTVTPDEVRYEVVQPADARDHSFAVNRSELNVRRWTVLGRPEPGIEIRLGRSAQVLLQLADEREVRAGAALRLAPPAALGPDRMLQAMREAPPGAQAGGGPGPAAGLPLPGADAIAPPQALIDRAATVFPRPAGPPRFSDGVGFVAPAGWSVLASSGATVIAGPVPAQERPCFVRVLAPVPAQPDLLMQAQALAVKFFAAPLSAFDEVHDVRATSYAGVSGAGWPYVDIYGRVGTARTTGKTVWGRILLARIGDRVVPIVGVTRSNNCLGSQSERDNDNWSLLFHSLVMPGFTEDSPILKQQLVGSWSVSGKATDVRTFAADGRYLNGSATSFVTDSSRAGYVDETTATAAGGGVYEVHGDRLTTAALTRSGVAKASTVFFSVARRPSPNKPGGIEVILRTVEHAAEHTWGFSSSGNYVASMSKD